MEHACLRWRPLLLLVACVCFAHAYVPLWGLQVPRRPGSGPPGAGAAATRPTTALSMSLAEWDTTTPGLGQRRGRSVDMSDRSPGAAAGAKSKGGVKVGVKEKADVKVSPKEKEKFEVEWRVLLHNDDVHTFDYVSRKLAEVVPTLTRSKAWECTLAAHSHDFSTLAIVTKGTAEEYCMKLQKAGLTISVAPDSNFQKDGEGFKGPQK